MDGRPWRALFFIACNPSLNLQKGCVEDHIPELGRCHQKGVRGRQEIVGDLGEKLTGGQPSLSGPLYPAQGLLPTAGSHVM